MKPIVNLRRKVGRNEPCPFCTSGRKFKKCHGAPTVTTPNYGVPVCRHAAGKRHERPAMYIDPLRTEALGPIPAERA